jgi:tRNA (guanine37-N1)-methyltransferase
MHIDIVTIFPAMVEHALQAGIVGRAIERGTLAVRVHDLRAFTSDRHHVVDDVPYGGGPGMVLKPEPIFRALAEISGVVEPRPTVLLTSPQGTQLTQSVAARLSRDARLVIVCGRYEGVDDRVRGLVDEEISIGDYVLSGGELPALVIVDSVARHVPGVVGDEQSVAEDSFSRGLLDFPHYTRPAELTIDERLPADGARALKVPDVLLSGNHAEIRHWRKREAISRTLQRRPDLLASADLDDEEREILRQLTAGKPE